MLHILILQQMEQENKKRHFRKEWILMSVMSLHLCLVLFSASSGFFDRADFPDLKKHRLQLMFPFHPRLYQSARLQLPSPPLNSSIRSSLYKSADCNYRLSFSLSLSV